jgi:hypothetical protein
MVTVWDSVTQMRMEAIIPTILATCQPDQTDELAAKASVLKVTGTWVGTKIDRYRSILATTPLLKIAAFVDYIDPAGQYVLPRLVAAVHMQ